MQPSRYRCRDPKCNAKHRDYFGGQCRRCKKPGMLREIKPGGMLETIAAAVSDANPSQRQPNLFGMHDYP